MKITRVWAMPNKHTFKIEPIRLLLARYMNGGVWADPFAGENSPAEWTNDLNPDKPTKYHLDAEAFSEILPKELDGVLFDPPYSLRQIKECYEGVGRTITGRELGWTREKLLLSEKIRVGGVVISFGWNTIGFGKERGFEIIEILIVSHGRAHNDTLVTVERKIQATFDYAPVKEEQ